MFALAASMALGPIAAQPLPSPDPLKGSIAVELRGWSPGGADRLQAVIVQFVRVEVDGDQYAAEHLIESTVAGDDGRVYLLNVEPGRYAAVAYRTRGGGFVAVRDTQWLFLEKPLIDATIVDVTPGAVAFAGVYVTGGTPWRRNAENKDEDKASAADSAQVHYLALMFPQAEQKSTLARIYGKNPVYLGNYLPKRSRGRGPEAEAEFWAEARKDRDLEEAWLSAFGK
jgi:hypothetical protein